MMVLKFSLILVCIATIYSKRFNGTSKWLREQKKSRQFSLFSIVSFPNDPCTSSTSTFPKGTCVTSGECSGNGGTAQGNCAAGFGVCCVFVSSTCGSTISKNCTYITNPGYPSTYSTTGSCKWTVGKSSADVCQLRLDFAALALHIMPTDGTAKNSNLGCCGSSCATIIIVATITVDSFIAKGQTGVNPPTICGINTGYHMYVEMGTEDEDTASLEVYLGSGTTGTRSWNIKVSQISCTANWRVPAGCVQYHTGLTGKVASYGHQSGQFLQKQNYNNCIRQEIGYCSLVWDEAGQASLAGSASASPDPFSLPGSSATTNLGENDVCPVGHVYISNGNMGEPGIATYLGNTFCGEALSCEKCAAALASPAGRPLPTSTDSFYLGVWSTSDTNMGTNPTTTAATGFNMRYTQQPCGSANRKMP